MCGGGGGGVYAYVCVCVCVCVHACVVVCTGLFLQVNTFYALNEQNFPDRFNYTLRYSFVWYMSVVFRCRDRGLRRLKQWLWRVCVCQETLKKLRLQGMNQYGLKGEYLKSGEKEC